MSSLAGFKVKGGQALKGKVTVSGSKNAILPLLFSTLLADGSHEFHNVPNLEDVQTALKLLQALGLSVFQEGSVLQVKTPSDFGTQPPSDLVRKMRASVLCLGPLLSRKKQATLCLPGGCVIGERPIDIHLKGFESMGATFQRKENQIEFQVKKSLKGASITFPFPTVGGTENLIMGAVLAQGKTVLKNQALEPEVFDLIEYLKQMGAKITVLSSREILIEGVEKLSPPPYYKVIPDRIEGGTFLLAGALTEGEIAIQKCCPEHLTEVIKKLRASGFFVETSKDEIWLKSTSLRKALKVETGAYPGFPTDLQAPFMVLMTQLNGISLMMENVFENRFRHVAELKKMKAIIDVKDKNKAYIRGPISLLGSEVHGTDLRASASLILAGLIAKGETTVLSIEYLLRGYENFHVKLKSLGAQIEPFFRT